MAPNVRENTSHAKGSPRIRLSLRTLLVGLTMAGLGFVIWRQHLDLQATRQRLQQVLQKGGLLEISDPDRIHVVRVNAWGEDLTWRWRIYVPPGRTASLNIRADAIPMTGFPKSTSRRELPPGEHVVSYSFRKNAEGDIHAIGDFVSEDNAAGRVLNRPNLDFSWLEQRDEFMEQSVVGLDADAINAWLDSRTLPVDGAFTLLRLRKVKGELKRSELTPGFMVWVEDTAK